MKAGSSVDEDGELIDVNKVQTALASVGVSLLDAQGQFRDFDDVIFELADKWDTLDKNSQRYVATIAAGNRQQSRFIALVSHADRLREVADSAANSEDAGLIQYAKTLDSLETKLNNLKTSFQQFYMDIFNGEFFKGIIGGITNLLDGLNKLSKPTALLNFVSVIQGMKIIGNVLVSAFTSAFGQIRANWKQLFEDMVKTAQTKSKEAGQQSGQEFKEGQRGSGVEQEIKYLPIRKTRSQWMDGQKVGERTVYDRDAITHNLKTFGSAHKNSLITGGYAAASLLSLAGTAISKNNQTAGAWTSGIGNGLNMGLNAFMLSSSIPGLQAFAPAIGLATGAITTFVSAMSSIPTAAEKAQEALDKATEVSNQKDIERAEARERATNLKNTLDNLERLKKAQYDSAEAQQEYIDAQNSAFESFPELATGFDEVGNAIIDASNAERLLADARKKASEATIAAAAAEYSEKNAQQAAGWVDARKSVSQYGNNYGSMLAQKLLTNGIYDGDVRSNIYSKDKSMAFNEMNNILSSSGLNISAWVYLEGGEDARSGWLNTLEADGWKDRFLSAYEKYNAATQQQNLFEGFMSMGYENQIGKDYLDKFTAPEVLNYAINKGASFFGLEQTDFEDRITEFAELTDFVTKEDATYADVLAEVNKYTSLFTTNEAERIASLDANVIASIQDYLQGKDPTGEGIAWQTEIDDASAAFYKRAEEKIYKDFNLIIDPETKEQTWEPKDGEDNLQERLDQLYKSYDEFYNQLLENSNVDDFNELNRLLNAGTISSDEYKNRLTGLIGVENEESIGWQFANGLLTEVTEIQNTFSKALKKEEWGGDASRWSGIADAAGQIPASLYDGIVENVNLVQENLENQRMTASQADSYATAYSNLISQISSITNSTVQAAMWELLGDADTDLFSIVGIEAFKKQAMDLGFEIDDTVFDDLETNIPVNLVTEYSGLVSDITKNADQFLDAINKAKNGFDNLTEAAEFAKKWGVSINDFKTIDGKLYFTDFEAIQKNYESELGEAQTKVEEAFGKAKTTAGGFGEIDFSVGADATNSWQSKKKELENKLKDATISDENKQDIIDQISLLDTYSTGYQEWLKENKDKSFVDYLTQLEQAELDALNLKKEDLEEWAAEEMAATDAALALQIKYKDSKAEANRAIAEKGAEGYDNTEMGKYQALFGWKEGTDFKFDQTTGTYTITDEGLKDLQISTQNAIKNLYSSELQSAIDAATNLGEEASKIGGADRGTYAEFYKDAFKYHSSDFYEKRIPELLEGISTGDDELKEQNKQILTRYELARLQKIDSNATLEDAEESANKIIAAYNDGIEEAIETVRDMKLEALNKGFISETDHNTLSKVEGGKDWLEKFDAAIAKEGEERANQIFSLVKEVYQDQLKDKKITKDEYLKNITSSIEDQLDFLYSNLADAEFTSDVTSAAIKGNLVYQRTDYSKLLAAAMELKDNQGNLVYETLEDAAAELGTLTDQGFQVNLTKLKEKGLIDDSDFAEAQHNILDTTFSSLKAVAEKFAAGERVYEDEIDAIFESLGIKDISEAAYESLEGLISSMVSGLKSVGLEDVEIISKVKELQAQILDAIIQSISDGLSNLTEGLDGTLSNEAFNSLQTKYNLTGQGATYTSKGVALGIKDQQTLVEKLYKSAEEAGLEAEFGDQLWEAWQKAEQPIFEGYLEIEDAIRACYDEQGALINGTEDWVKALQQAKIAALQSADAFEFSFMDRDPFEGMAGGFDNFVDSIDSVKSALQGLKTDEEMSVQDFFNIIDFIDRLGMGEQVLTAMGVDLERFGNDIQNWANDVAMASTTIGKIDVAGIEATGASLGGAVGAMADGMTDGLKKVAKQQVEYYSGLEAMLEALLALESMGEVDMSFGIDIAGNGFEGKTYQLKDLEELWKEIDALEDKELRVKVIGEVNTKVGDIIKNLGKEGGDNSLNSLLKKWGKADQTITDLFFGGQFSINNADHREMAGLFQEYAAQLNNVSETQAIALSQRFWGALEGSFEFDDNGKIKNVKDDFLKKFKEALGDVDWNNLPEATDIELQADLQAKIATKFNNNEVQINGDKIKVLEGTVKQELADYIKKYYSGKGYEADVFIDADGNVTVNIVNIQAKTFIKDDDGWEEDVNNELGSHYATKALDFDTTVEGSATVKLNLHTGKFEINPTGEFDNYWDEGSGTWDTEAIKQLVEQMLGISTSNFNVTGKKGAATVTFGFAVDEQGDTTLASLAADVAAIKEALTGENEFNLSTEDAVSKIKTLAEEAKAAFQDIPITLDFSNLGGENTDPTQQQGLQNLSTDATSAATPLKEIWLSLANTVTLLNSIFTSQAMKRLSEEAKTAEEAVKALDGEVQTLKESLTADETATSFINALITLTQGIFENNEVIDLSSLFNFVEIDTTAIEAITTAINGIQQALDNIQAQSISDIGDAAAIAEGQLDHMVGELDAAAGALGRLGTITFGSDGGTSLSDLTTALEKLNENNNLIIGADITAAQAAIENINGTEIPPKTLVINANASAAQQIYSSFTNKTVTITINARDNTGGLALPGSSAKAYAGNVLTGKALVNGQQYGAALAGKTLVGELGPELAVYDNQYHLLGQDGAEFVNLPSDAIVFNHLQTQGIINGKVDNIRGTQLNAAYQRAQMFSGNALVNGNVSGPSALSGIASALSAVQRAKSIWQGLLNSLSAADLLGGAGSGGGGGGGGGKTQNLKPYIGDLQEWYNLSRQIAYLEGQINTLIAKRNNLSKGFDQGAAYLRNLKESQALLQDQLNTQKDLYRYQQDELKRQADAINDSNNWISQFYHVGADGVLQYNEGNETNGGKGALEVLQKLNEMGENTEKNTIKDQVAYIKEITDGAFERGFTWEEETDDEGKGTGKYKKKEWTDEEYVQEFFSALQEPIDDYDALQDAVWETETELEDLANEIEKINDEIRDNEIELTELIFDAVEQVREKAIDGLEESNKLIIDANKAYADSLSEAINQEKQLYEQNKTIQDRELLQRQLSLLRRSGGSAADIASLERTINDYLKDEYFTNQQNTLDTIKEANEKQQELMEQQVQLMKDSLEYDKENGVLWTKVYEVLAEGNAFTLDFLSGAGADGFLEKANVEQEKMLEEWAFKIGLYGENERSNYLENKYAQPAYEALMNNTSSWAAGYKQIFDSMDAATKEEWKNDYIDAYNSYMLENTSGQSTEAEIAAAKQAASAKAEETFFEHIKQEKKRRDDEKTSAEKKTTNNSSSSSSSSSSKQSSTKTATKYTWTNSVTGESGYAYSKSAAQSAVQASYNNYAKAAGGSLAGTTTKEELNKKIEEDKNSVKASKKTGGSIANTGLYMLHGSPRNPEYVLNAKQTRGMEQLITFTERNPDFVDVLKAHYDALAGDVSGRDYSTLQNKTINIAEGAIQIAVEKLNDKYDIEDISNDIMDRMYSIAAKASSRGVSRR